MASITNRGEGYCGSRQQGGPAPVPGQRSTLERAVFKLTSKGGIKVSWAAGGEGRLCSVFWVGGTVCEGLKGESRGV